MTETKFGNIQTKFTPGKYHVVRHNWKECSIEADSGYAMCTSDIGSEVDEDGENQDEVMEWQDAQMAFFAAAPDMYEALEEILKMEGAYSIDPLQHAHNVMAHIQVLAHQALAKARGENQ